jgi:hypothetical protein
MLEHIVSIGMLNFDALFDIHRQTFFIDLDIESFFGAELDNMPAPRFRQLQLDDPRITEGYIKFLHKLLTTHYIYKRAKNIPTRGKKEDWTM